MGAYKQRVWNRCSQHECAKDTEYAVFDENGCLIGRFCEAHADRMIDRLNERPTPAAKEAK